MRDHASSRMAIYRLYSNFSHILTKDLHREGRRRENYVYTEIKPMCFGHDVGCGK